MSAPETTVPPVSLPTLHQLVVGSVVGVVVATVALVFFILPAELGVDLTGFGARTGLTGLAQSGPAANIYLERGLKRRDVLFPLDTASQPSEATLRATLAAKGIAIPTGARFRSDHWEYELPPFESIEMKYRLEKGQAMVFAWNSAVPVHVDMHSVPDQGGDDATESFVITDLSSQRAGYVAPFTGIHGWFWQNQTFNPVKIRIDATGAFGGAVIFDSSGEHPRALADGAPAPVR